MPIYEYQCEECEAITEKLRKMNELDDPCECEKCGKPAHRKISTSNFKVNGASFKNGYTSTVKGAVNSNKQFNRRKK